MMKEEIYAKLKTLEDDSEKINFLEEQIEKDELEQETKAVIYELLGDLYVKAEKPRGDLFEKAASAWEIFSVSKKEGEKETLSYKKDALKSALKDYEKAVSMYKRANEKALGEEAKVHVRYLKKEIGGMGGPVRTLSILGVVVIFLLSFFLLSPTPTGLVVSNVEKSDTTLVGFFLVIAGILGAVFVIWRWK
jgi:hypothetical protein